MERPNRTQRKQREQRRQRRQHRARLMLICCLIVAASGYLCWSPGLAAVSDGLQDISQQGVISQEVVQPVMLTGYQANPVVRDPFAIPKEFQPVSPIPVMSQPRATNFQSGENTVSPQPKIPEIALELVGIVSGGGQKVAIVKKTGVSRSYQIKDYIGPYQLLAVGETSATLWGPQGRKVLSLER